MTQMSYNNMHMSDTKSLGVAVGHNVRHVKTFYRNTASMTMNTHYHVTYVQKVICTRKNGHV